jgi:hypothetical protein
MGLLGIVPGLCATDAVAIPVGAVMIANTELACTAGSGCDANPESGFVGVSMVALGVALLITGIVLAAP